MRNQTQQNISLGFSRCNDITKVSVPGIEVQSTRLEIESFYRNSTKTLEGLLIFLKSSKHTFLKR